MKYLKNKYIRPAVMKNEFYNLFTHSYGNKTKLPKIIIKGLTLLDACLDIEGNIIPGKSTLIICNKNTELLYALLALINSPIIFSYIKEKYQSNSYNEGIVFQKSMINNLPIPDFDNIALSQLSYFGRELYNHTNEFNSISDTFLTLAETQFNISRQSMTFWHKTDFDNWVKKSNILLNTSSKEEWLLLFSKYKNKAMLEKTKIKKLEDERDAFISKQYNLSDTDINLVHEN